MTDALETRRALIIGLIDALRGTWSLLLPELQARALSRTAQLVAVNDEQTRGRIKELQDLQDLPTCLQYELEAIQAALSDPDAAE